MPYGILKIDTITFTDGGVDKSVPVSGLVLNPTFTGNVTVTGTISGNIIQGGTTVSGLTVTGTTANFASGVFTTQVSGLLITGPTVSATTGTFTSLTGTTTNGTTASFTTGNFTSLTGTTTTGTTANFASGVFTTQVSGLLITGPTVSATTGTFTSLTGTTTTGTTANFASGVFTTQISGVTITGTTVSTTTGNFTSLTGTTATITSGIIASGTAALPSLAILSDPNTGIYSPGADQLAVATNGTGRLFIDASGNVGINTVSAIAPGGYGYAREFAFTGDTSGDSSVGFNLRGSRTVAGGFADINFWHQSTANRAYIQARRGSSDSAIDLDFITSGGAGMRITSAGLVGIGTSTPSQKLQIATGNVQIDSNYGFIWDNSTTGIYGNSSPSVLQFYTGNAERMRVTSTGVGIGTTSPGYLVTAATSADGVDGVSVESPSVNGVIRLRADGTNGNAIRVGGVGAQGNTLRFLAGSDTERMRIDSSGRLLVGTSTARSNFYNDTNTAAIQVEGADNDRSALAIVQNFNSNTLGAQLILAKSNTTSIGSNTLVANDDRCGVVSFQGNDGTQFVEAAFIRGEVDGTPGANDMPGRLVFSTTADGGSSPTERMRISQAGNVGIGGAADPASLLHLAGGGTGARGALRISDAGGSNYWEIGRDNNTSGDFTINLLGSEKARIDTNGIFIVGATSNGGAGGLSVYPIGSGAGSAAIAVWNKTNTGAEAAAQFRVSATTVGSISYSNTAVAFNTTSDYRLKENVTPITNGITRFQQLKPSKFNFIIEPDKTVEGFLAHEAQAVVPECVTGEKDAVDEDGNPVYQGIDQSKLVPLLTAALQEAIARIESLEARLTAAGL